MNAKRVSAAAGVLHASQVKGRQTAAGLAADLESACLLQSPETAAELERLRAEVVELEAQRTADHETWQHDLRAARSEREATAVRIAGLEKRLHEAAMTRVWTNEDGKRFVFVEDIAPALLGLEPKPDGITRRIAPVASYREDPHDSPLHHPYRLGHDLPETGGAL